MRTGSEDLWPAVEKLFLAARNHPAPERSPFLERECHGDEILHGEVQSLLACDRGACLLDESLEEVLLQGRAIGPFAIRRTIAVGGMGVVFEAQQTSPPRTVALKVLRQGLDSPDIQRRFDYEVEVLGRLHHPTVAEIYAAGVHSPPGSPWSVRYFAMEYVPGAESITAYCRGQELGIRECIILFAQVCAAVHHGHQKGIIHRDLKPSNILVAADGQPKVIDFGLAKAIQAEPDGSPSTRAGHSTRVGQILGTTQYMSPEQCDVDPTALDARSDVYSLGVVLYELLCGQLPYEVPTNSVLAACRTIREVHPCPPSSRDARIRGDLERVVLKALQKDPTQRYQSAWDLKTDLSRFLEHRPVLARPPGLAYVLNRLVRHHRLFVGALVLALLLLVTGGVGTIIGFHRARSNARDAEQQARLAGLRQGDAEGAPGEAHPYTLTTRVNLANCRLCQGAIQAAIPVFERIRRIVSEKPQIAPHGGEQVRQNLVALVDLYRVWGLADEAEHHALMLEEP